MAATVAGLLQGLEVGAVKQANSGKGFHRRKEVKWLYKQTMTNRKPRSRESEALVTGNVQNFHAFNLIYCHV